jgi:hypothetical protein
VVVGDEVERGVVLVLQVDELAQGFVPERTRSSRLDRFGALAPPAPDADVFFAFEADTTRLSPRPA